MGKPPSGFTYRVTADDRVLIAWGGRHVVTLTGSKAAKFIRDSTGLGDPELQLLLARLTGNFKRGNERAPREQ